MSLTPEQARRWSTAKGRPLAERFWEKVDKSPGQGPKGECWEWKASFREHGYGQFAVRENGETVIKVASRFAYELTYGPLPEGMLACHTCDNPPCCRPTHLFAGTHKENIEDAQAKGRFPVAVPDEREQIRHFRLTKEQTAMLKQTRRSVKFSIYDAANMLCIDIAAYSRKENGKIRFAETEITVLCSKLNLNIDSFQVEETISKRPKRRTSKRRAPKRICEGVERKCWKKLPEPETALYRADLIIKRFAERRTSFSEIKNATGIWHGAQKMVYAGKPAPLKYIKSIVAYAGLSMREVMPVITYSLKAAA